MGWDRVTGTQRRAGRPGDVMGVLMAEKRAAGGKKPDVEYTTLRFYAQDGEELSELASAEKKTIAEVYRELLAPLVKKRLIQRTEERLRKMKGE